MEIRNPQRYEIFLDIPGMLDSLLSVLSELHFNMGLLTEAKLNLPYIVNDELKLLKIELGSHRIAIAP